MDKTKNKASFTINQLSLKCHEPNALIINSINCL